MAKQRKLLPARRTNPADNSLLIRSAESLGRMIGSLQRQLDEARQLTIRSGGTKPRANGQAANGQRAAGGGTKRQTKSTAAAAKTSAASKKTTAAGSRGGAKRRTTKTTRRR